LRKNAAAELPLGGGFLLQPAYLPKSHSHDPMIRLWDSRIPPLEQRR